MQFPIMRIEETDRKVYKAKKEKSLLANIITQKMRRFLSEKECEEMRERQSSEER